MIDLILFMKISTWNLLCFPLKRNHTSLNLSSTIIQHLGGYSHYSDVIMGTMASQITSLTIVYLSVCSGADQRKHKSYASLAFVCGIHGRPVNSPHKGPVMQKMVPFDDVIMTRALAAECWPTPNCSSRNFHCLKIPFIVVPDDTY